MTDLNIFILAYEEQIGIKIKPKSAYRVENNGRESKLRILEIGKSLDGKIKDSYHLEMIF